MVVANNTRSKTTPRVWRLQKQCVSLSAKRSSRRCKVASARGTRNYHSPAEEILRALAPEHGSSHFITPMHHSGGHLTRPGDVEQCNILFPSPEFQISVGIKNDFPILSGSDAIVVLNPDGDDLPTVTTVKEVSGRSVSADGEALAAAEERPPHTSGELIPQNEDEVGLTFRDYPPQPPDDSSIFSEWLLNVPLPFGKNDPPLTISHINRVDHRLSHLSS